MIEGALPKSGVAALADMAAVAVLPCVILGSDRLYNKKSWLPLRRIPIWIAFGESITHLSGEGKPANRQRVESEFAAALKSLSRELQERFSLTAKDLPHPPRQRMLE